jgi:hypothetical protein
MESYEAVVKMGNILALLELVQANCLCSHLPRAAQYSGNQVWKFMCKECEVEDYVGMWVKYG